MITVVLTPVQEEICRDVALARQNQQSSRGVATLKDDVVMVLCEIGFVPNNVTLVGWLDRPLFDAEREIAARRLAQEVLALR